MSIKQNDDLAVVRIEITGRNAESVRENLRGLLAEEVSHVTNNVSGFQVSALVSDTDITHANVDIEALRATWQKELEAESAELERTSAMLSERTAALAVAEAHLKDARKGNDKLVKELEKEQARVIDLETQLKTLRAQPAATPADASTTNDTEADAAIGEPETVASEAVKVTPAPRTARTTRQVTKPAEETAEQKAVRETIVNDLLDLGGLAEKNEQVAKDVEEVLAKFGIQNAADLTTEQLQPAADAVAELIGIYFK